MSEVKIEFDFNNCVAKMCRRNVRVAGGGHFVSRHCRVAKIKFFGLSIVTTLNSLRHDNDTYDT